MILTTTENVPGREIVEYKGLATGEVVSGMNFFKDFGAGLRDMFGGRSAGYEKEITQARDNALKELKSRARQMGANAVVGVKLDMETIGGNGSMVLISVVGTAVVVN